MPRTLYEGLFSTPAMTACFSDEAFVCHMVDIERSLARVQGRLGIIPEDAAKTIDEGLKGFCADLSIIAPETSASSIPTLALLKQLRAKLPNEAASFIHWGITSQDLMDTALVLQMRLALTQLQAQLKQLIMNLADLAEAHVETLMVGRTHAQQALPFTFGHKVANWLAPLLRQQQRLSELMPRVLIVQCGGAVGTLASMAEQGQVVQRQLAQELGLSVPYLPWHTQRDALVELANWLSMLTASLAKIAQDIILMAQSEVAELKESADPERGGSSTMPQKSNPVQSELIITAARHCAQLLASMHQAMIQEHERATHGWQLEWLALPQLFELSASALAKALWLSTNMVVDETQMVANVKASKGLMLAEYYSFEAAKLMPRAEAKKLIAGAAREAMQSKRHLAEVLAEQSVIAIDWLALADEGQYLGESQAMVRHVIQEARQVQDE